MQFRPFLNASKEGGEGRGGHALSSHPASPAVSPRSSSDLKSSPAILPDVAGQDFAPNVGPFSQARQNFSSNFNVLKIFPSACRVT